MTSLAQVMELWRGGRRDEAERHCEVLARAGTQQGEALDLLAEMYASRGAQEQALAALRRRVGLGDAEAGVWRRLGDALLASGQYAEAEASFREAVKLEPGSVRGHNNLGQALIRQGRGPEAIASYRQALALDAGYVIGHRNLGIALQEEGDLEAALASYERALALRPEVVDTLVRHGDVQRQLLRNDAALLSYERALKLDPRSFQSQSGHARALLALGRRDEALASLDRALKIEPDNALALKERGALLFLLKRPAEALEACDRALLVQPDLAVAHVHRAAALVELNRGQEALASCDRALELDPDLAEAHCNRAGALRLLHREEEAILACRRALELKPEFAAAMANLAALLAWAGELEEARDCFARAVALDPDRAALRVGLLMTQVPVIAESPAAADAARAAFAAELARLERWLSAQPAIEEPSVAGSSYTFFLAYQEVDNKPLLGQFGRLSARLMERWQQREGLRPATLDRPASTPGGRNGRLKVGIVSAHVRDHSVYRAITRGLLQQLDRDQSDVVLFDVGPDQDSETSQARLLAGTYESGQRSLADWVRTIERRGVDVLIYPEVGMDPITQQLASLRLARHQLVSWGHPETTGLPTIDCYLSAAAFESPEADAYYSERLVRLPGLGSYYEPSPERPDAVDMAQLGLDRESPLLVSAGTPFKYGPHHDAVWLQVARQLGRCQLVFFESPFTRMNRKFRTRLEAAFSASGLAPGEFLRFVPWQTASGFLGLLAEADVFLDTIGFSGFNTVMQAVECNLPVVTVAGRFMRGRFGSGILTEMGMPEYIAGSADDYATQAVRLAGDKDVNARMRQRMREASSALFQNRAAIAALDDLLGSLGT